MSQELPKRILSMDDIRAGLSDMAENGEGAQRAQAYRMLMNMESATFTLPPPLTTDERIDRLSRLMKACGMDDSQVAFHRAWPNTKKKADSVPDLTMEQLPAKVRWTAQQIKSLPQFFRAFPELKRHGAHPNGYPRGVGKVKQALWLQHEAAKILLDRMQDSMEPPKDGPTPEST